MSKSISRRTLLKGLGTAVALPWLEAMALPAIAGNPVKKPPLRMAFLYVPNGVNVRQWKPTELGEAFELPGSLEPLTPFKKDMMVLGGLTLDGARAHGDGGGDHARAMSSFLTGAHPRKTHGADIKAGISVDQLAAQKVGQTTKFASLEIGCDRGPQSGNCDSGYSCAYSANLSWRTESTPMAKEIDPKLIFDRLFSDGSGDDAIARARRDRYRKSVLDFVLEDANRLKSKLGVVDQRKMDEYLTGVREIETRIQKSAATTVKSPSGFARPSGIPQEYEAHIRILADLLVLAFQGDLTRISTFVFANEGSNRSYRHIGVPDGHHDLSHHAGNKEKLEKIHKINRFHVTQLAYFVERLAAVKESDGSSLLDNSMIVYGSGNGDGNRHNHDDLPILLLGKGGGTLKTGRHVQYPRETPLTNLYVSMLNRVGVKVDQFGDSTGALDDLG